MLTPAFLVCTAFLKDLDVKTNLFMKCSISVKEVISLINCCLHQGLDLRYETYEP